MNEVSLPPPDPRALPPADSARIIGKVSHPARLVVPDPTPIYSWPAREEAHFFEHWRVLARHRWIVIAFFLSTMIATGVWTLSTRPTFTGTVMLRIEREEPRVVKFEEVVRADTQENYYQTQYQILTSRTLANSVIGGLELDKHPDFQEDPGWYETLRGWVRRQLDRWAFVPPPIEPGAADGLGVVSPLTDAFLGRLTVEPVRNSRLVRVSFDSHYPDLAARVPNTVAETFITQQLDDKAQTTRYAIEFLTRQLKDSATILKDSEARLNAFVKDKDILFLTGDRTDQPGERQDLISRQLSMLSDALLKARAERIAKESLFAQTVSHDTDSLPAVLTSSLIGRRKEELANLEAEYRKLGLDFKPDYPRMKQIERATAEIRGQLRQEVRRVVESLDADYRAALRGELELQKAVDNHLQLARRLGDEMPQYRVLRRDVDTNREVYTSLLTRLKETQVSSALITSNISMVDRAEIPIRPSKPRKALNLLLGALVGLFGGVALAFLVEHLDTTIRDEKEIPTLLRVPTLGLVPSWAALDGQRLFPRRRLAEGSDGGPFALVTHAQLASIFSEAFRALRTSLLYCAPDLPPKTLMVTSLASEDGKTAIASNLAITLAQLGAGDILLIDADLRHPNLHELFAVPHMPGLSTFLAGKAKLPKIIKPSMISNLYVIPAGRASGSPADLLASPRLGAMLEVLADRFAHIVFDTSPLFGITDALIVASRVEGVVLVLRQGRAHREDAQRAIQLLASVRAPCLGVILNRMNPRAAGFYGYSRHENGNQ